MTFVSALTTLSGDLYAGGNFDRISALRVSRIARWDGSSWYPLDRGVRGRESDPSEHALAVHDGDLYVGGNFYKAGEYQSLNIARWYRKKLH